MSEAVFWTSSVTPLLIGCLHALREYCTPNRYKPQNITLHEYEETAELAPSERTPLTHDLHASMDKVERQGDDADLLYEDDYLIVFKKKDGISSQGQMLFYKWNTYYHSVQHSPINAARQFSAAGIIYLAQCYFYHEASMMTVQAVEDKTINRFLALATLLTPAATLLLSSVFLVCAIERARKFPDGLSAMAKLLVEHVLACTVMLSWLSLLVPVWNLFVE